MTTATATLPAATEARAIVYRTMGSQGRSSG
jgi:hypothetical protein